MKKQAKQKYNKTTEQAKTKQKSNQIAIKLAVLHQLIVKFFYFCFVESSIR